MAFSALDSGLTGPLFATDAMRACFSDTARLRAMLAVSCTVILAAHGVAPGLAAARLGGMAAAHERPAGL